LVSPSFVPAMASPQGPPPERRDGLLHEIFHVLDQKQRGFVSKVELSHILDAMQADAGRHRLSIPEGLSPRKILRDCRVNLQDMTGFLEELTVADLEDVKWFAESVVKVETELRDLWVFALRRWREDLLRLQSRELHQYLLNSQPKAVSRWLQLRDGATTSPTNGPGLGFSLHEVETLFAANTAEEINSYQQQMEPFLQALDVRRQLEIITAGEVWTKRSQPEFLAAQKTEKLQKDQIKQEKDSAFELLDALTKSGALALSHATLHVVLCASQCFENGTMKSCSKYGGGHGTVAAALRSRRHQGHSMLADP